MPQNNYPDYASAAPAQGAFNITPSDSANVTHTTRGIFCGGAGNLSVIMANGENAFFTGLLAGVVYPFCVTRVYSSGTSATNLVGLY